MVFSLAVFALNKQFNWYKKTTGTQRYTTLTCVQALKICVCQWPLL